MTYDATALDIDEPIVPRVRRRPARFVESTADARVFSDAKSLHRKQYFEIIDAAITSLEERFIHKILIRSGNWNQILCEQHRLTTAIFLR